VAAFPLLPLLAIINNNVELKLDGYKLLKVFQRPAPTPASSIGVWHHFMNIQVDAIQNSTTLTYFNLPTRTWYLPIVKFCLTHPPTLPTHPPIKSLMCTITNMAIVCFTSDLLEVG
jgi:hypothetical protein